MVRFARIGSHAPNAGTTEKEYTGSGGMIAWQVPRALAERLALSGGEKPEDLHMTLCFFPDIEKTDIAAVAEAMGFVSASFGTLRGEVSGLGRFSIDDGDAVIALIDVPELTRLREALVYELRERGVVYANDHGFTPHVTLAYLKPGATKMPVQRLEPTPVTISSLTLFGKNEPVGEVLLTGEKAQGIPEGDYDAPPPAGPFEDEWRAAEEAYATMLAKGFAGLWRRVRAELRSDPVLAAQKDMNAFGDPAWWEAARTAELAQVETSALALLEQGATQAAQLGLPVDFELVHQEALALAQEYGGEWWEQFSSTTQRQLRSALSEHIATGGRLRDLEQKIAPLFGQARAKVIATTETTRLYAEGNRRAYASSGIVETVEWRTANDERVEGRCSALLGQRYALGAEEFVPPLHPSCRCWLAPVVCPPTLEGARAKQEGCEPVLTRAVVDDDIPTFSTVGTEKERKEAAEFWSSSSSVSRDMQRHSQLLFENPKAFDPDIHRQAASLHNAISEGPRWKTLFRGMAVSEQDASNLLAYQKGQSYTLPLTSFSKDAKVGRGFAQRMRQADPSGRPVEVHISVRNSRGYDVQSSLRRSDPRYREREVVSAGRFTIVEVRREGNSIFLELEG